MLVLQADHALVKAILDGQHTKNWKLEAHALLGKS